MLVLSCLAGLQEWYAGAHLSGCCRDELFSFEMCRARRDRTGIVQG